MLVVHRMRTETRTLTPDRGWISGLGLPHVGDRDTVLVWAANPLRSALVELMRSYGFEVCAPETPLEAIETLIDTGDRISHALISLDSGLGLREFVADEYPAIECVMLDGAS